MVLDLYFVAKSSSANKNLSYWFDEDKDDCIEDTLSYNLEKFKFKNNNDHIAQDLSRELTYLLKETDYVKELFSQFNGSKLNIILVDNFHHLFIYDDEAQILKIDSRIDVKLAPLYLFAVYFSIARTKLSANEIYKTMYDFLLAFDFRALKASYDYLNHDANTSQNFDPGSYFLSYFEEIYKVKTGELQTSSILDIDKYRKTQLLRNRTLAGKSPYDIERFEQILENDSRDDLFSGEVNQELFDIMSESYDASYAQAYYEHLGQSLQVIGLKVVAQRGSRVAHEQGPILVNAPMLSFQEDFSIQVKKVKSHIEENALTLKKEVTNIDEALFSQADLLELNMILDSLVYLADLPEFQQARFKKELLLLQNAANAFHSGLRKYLKESVSLDRDYDFDKVQQVLVLINSHEAFVEESFMTLTKLLKHNPGSTRNAVIYVQRVSARSGHFLPRILLGQKLYVETDEQSEINRLDAIPFNFVVPDFDLIASHANSFFENASISIVTDRDTGAPEIKWDNAEDLAKTLAPSLYKAIANSKDPYFHYQLETTLLGPLIELFKVILENEISNYASIAKFVESQGPNQSIESVLDKYLSDYKNQIVDAANYAVRFYLLENRLEEIILLEKLSREDAMIELLKTLRDVQFDSFALMLKLRKEDIKSQLEAILEKDLSVQERLTEFQALIKDSAPRSEIRKEIKDKLFYPVSTAIRDFFRDNSCLQKLKLSSDKSKTDADFFYNFSVAPSRIDFGRHVVASITTLMGRMIGADDKEALRIAKTYIDYVSQSQNSIFGSSSEAGSVKVIENTCRAIQYAKAISFQGSFQAFDVDGMLARQTINSRNTRAAGLHVMEYGTMASTGYCITKEPLFILLGLALNDKEVFEKLGIQDEKTQSLLIDFFKELLAAKANFATQYEWELHAYEEIVASPLIQAQLADPEFKVLPRPEAMLVLLKYMTSENQDHEISQAYNNLAAKLIEFSRVVNETGIIQRIQLANNAIAKADKKYSDLKVLLNASYKGNVSDERENANQYMIAFILHRKEFLKNSSDSEIAKMIDFQITNHGMPKEIKIFDPYVDEDIFMGGELENIAASLVEKIAMLDLEPAMAPEVIEASLVTYGSDLSKWSLFQERLARSPKKTEIEKSLVSWLSDIKLAELYYKGFYKKADQAFQNSDVVFLNSDHNEQRELFADLVRLKELMMVNNPDSLLLLVDNPQQAKKPFMDYDLAREWLALGGRLVSHMIAPSIYDKWQQEISSEAHFAKVYMQKLILESKYGEEELSQSDEYQTMHAFISDYFVDLKKNADLYRDLCLQKFTEAKEIEVDIRILNRYQYRAKTLAEIASYEDANAFNFVDWLVLGGRWVLNGKSKAEIDYIIQAFNDSSKKVGKLGYEVLEHFVSACDDLVIERRERIIENSGSTKEADLLVTNAADSLMQRGELQNSYLLASLRLQNLFKFEAKYKDMNLDSLSSSWEQTVQDMMTLVCNKSQDLKEINTKFSALLKLTELYSKYFENYLPGLQNAVREYTSQRAFEENSLQVFFGDHKSSQGLFAELCTNINKSAKDLDKTLDDAVKLAEMLYMNHLLFLTMDIIDENEMVNKLAIFFDEYLNVHEEDYPPYMFHSLCAGKAFGFDQTYFYDTNLRVKMLKLACKSGVHIYKHLHFLISQRTVLAQTSSEYKDALIGDYENGLMPICYQHETICIEERLWDCMRALRNFIRNYHDRHPLPVIIKSQDATVDKLFRYNLDAETRLVWIAGISSPGKHSWDMNCVFRSPELRKSYVGNNTMYANISVFAPYLTPEAKIKQVYTAFAPAALTDIEILKPIEDAEFDLNAYGFVHAVVDLQNEDLPSPDITMSAHTHPQYISNFVAELGVPEVWSQLSMKQMYAKTELRKILEKVDVSSLAQVEFMHKEFDSKEEVVKTLENRMANRKFDHIEYWIIKASRDSGGRGISGKMHLKRNKDEIVDFIYEKTKTDDVVMQEFVPNNARSFINNAFYQNIVSTFVEAGIAIDNVTPFEQLYFAMRSFQSFSGIKGYLFSVNIGSVTVNAGQGAKLFYGEPIRIMPVYIAAKIQKLLDEEGEKILKEAIPAHAKEFARENNEKIYENIIGSNNCFMLNGLFDYIPYLYVIRKDKEGDFREFKVDCQDNAYGGLDFSYNFFGNKITVISGRNQEDSVQALENALKDSANDEWNGYEAKIDINLAKIELNSGLGQANLLQKTIEASAPDQKDLFLEWTEDLGTVALASQLAKNS